MQGASNKAHAFSCLSQFIDIHLFSGFFKWLSHLA